MLYYTVHLSRFLSHIQVSLTVTPCPFQYQWIKKDLDLNILEIRCYQPTIILCPNSGINTNLTFNFLHFKTERNVGSNHIGNFTKRHATGIPANILHADI